MKKFLVLAIAVACFASGCTKKYNSREEHIKGIKTVEQVKKYKNVEEYAKAMKAVQQVQKSYTLEAKVHNSWDSYYKAYIKKNLWKYVITTELSRNHSETVLYDGNKTVSYEEGSSKRATETKLQNISKKLLDWDVPNCFYNLGNHQFEFVNHNANMNGYDCRLIKYGNNYEFCVNDELGIAVYSKIKYKTRSGTNEIITNLLKADTKELPDSIFVLPSDKK